MLTEQCVACGADAPLSDAVHLLVNPKDGSDVADGYLCRPCYEERVEPLLPPDDEGGEGTDDGEEGRAGDEETSEDDARDDRQATREV